VVPQISCGCFKPLRVLFHQADSAIASGTEQAPWFSSFVVMVHGQAHDLPVTLCGFWFAANSANPVLRCKLLVVPVRVNSKSL
jgi:hypothetical protein